jgi:hypothetical protein
MDVDVGTFAKLALVQRTGKSILAKMLKNDVYGHLGLPQFVRYDQATVDGDTWYSVSVSDNIYGWLREQDSSMWAGNGLRPQGIGSYGVDVHEKLYTLLVLAWS